MNVSFLKCTMINKSMMLLVRRALLRLSHLISHHFPIDPFHESFRSIGVVLDHIPFLPALLTHLKRLFFSQTKFLMTQVMGLWEQQWSGIKMPAEDPPLPKPTKEVQETWCNSSRLSAYVGERALQVLSCSKQLQLNNSAQLLHQTSWNNSPHMNSAFLPVPTLCRIRIQSFKQSSLNTSCRADLQAISGQKHSFFSPGQSSLPPRVLREKVQKQSIPRCVQQNFTFQHWGSIVHATQGHWPQMPARDYGDTNPQHKQSQQALTANGSLHLHGRKYIKQIALTEFENQLFCKRHSKVFKCKKVQESMCGLLLAINLWQVTLFL